MSDNNIKEVIKKEYLKCAQDPVYFLKKYAVIQHPIQGKIPFSLYKFQEDTLYDFEKNNYNVILKARDEANEKMVRLVEPKWYENQYLWLGIGFVLGKI